MLCDNFELFAQCKIPLLEESALAVREVSALGFALERHFKLQMWLFPLELSLN
jgi:hypothetical protein